ncbi:MAG: PEP-CTERM sorting domain-containing protein [Verrucomicrobia bacterium]|nr:PEP-CTERM sorting domain-containing protein [Verrucomicrobiota bacterium]
MRKILIIATLAVLVSLGAYGAPTIGWGTNGAQLYQNDGITLIVGDFNDPADGYLTGGFVQLIFVDADGYNGFSQGGDGSAGNDVIVDVSWMGVGKAMNGDGTFIADYLNATYGPGSDFVIRFFEQPSANWTGGPTSQVPATGYFGVSGVFSSTLAVDSSDTEDFAILAPDTADQQVPEPSAIALALIGLGTIFFRRYRRK